MLQACGVPWGGLTPSVITGAQVGAHSPPTSAPGNVQTTCASPVPAGAFGDSFGVGAALVPQPRAPAAEAGGDLSAHRAAGTWEGALVPGARGRGLASPRLRTLAHVPVPPASSPFLPPGCPGPGALPGQCRPGWCWVSVGHATPVGCLVGRVHGARARTVPTDSVLAFCSFWHLNFIIKTGVFSLEYILAVQLEGGSCSEAQAFCSLPHGQA